MRTLPTNIHDPFSQAITDYLIACRYYKLPTVNGNYGWAFEADKYVLYHRSFGLEVGTIYFQALDTLSDDALAYHLDRITRLWKVSWRP